MSRRIEGATVQIDSVLLGNPRQKAGTTYALRIPESRETAKGSSSTNQGS